MANLTNGLHPAGLLILGDRCWCSCGPALVDVVLVKHVIALRLVGVERGDLTPKDASYLGTTQPGQLRDRAMRLSLGREAVDQLDLRRVNLGRSTQWRARGPKGGKAGRRPLRDEIPLELSEGGKDTEQEPPGGASGFDPRRGPGSSPHWREDSARSRMASDPHLDD